MRSFCFALLAVLLLAGCASDESFEQDAKYSSDSLQNTANAAAARDASSHGGSNPGPAAASEEQDRPR